MATAAVQPIVFIVPGQAQPAAATRGAAPAALPAGLLHGVVKQSVRVGARRGEGHDVRVTAVPGEDVVVLQIANGPALTLHPETARDLMLAQQGEIKRSRSRSGADQPGPNEVTVPAQLQWRGLEQSAAVRGKTRGFLGDVLLSAVQVITGAAKAARPTSSRRRQCSTLMTRSRPACMRFHPNPAAAERQGHAAEAGAGRARRRAAACVRAWHVLDHQRLVCKAVVAASAARALAVRKVRQPRLCAGASDARREPDQQCADARAGAAQGSAAAPGDALARRVGGRGARPRMREPRARLRRYRLLQRGRVQAQRDALTTLADEVRSRDIQVERIVRVGCPARGTLLASSGSMPTCRCSSGHSSWPASRSRPRSSNSWPKWRNAAPTP